MTESSQMLREKAGELESALDEVQAELARADATRRTDAHHRLAELSREARRWLESHDRDADGEAASAETQRAEAMLHEMRMLRGRI